MLFIFVFCGIPGTYIPGFCYDELFVGLLYLYSCMTMLGDVVWVLDYVVCSMVVPQHLFCLLVLCDKCIKNQVFGDSFIS